MGYQSNNTKAFIITLKLGNRQTQAFFQGKDTKQGNENFKNTCLLLNKVEDTSIDWNDFFNRAIELFRNNGFIRIAK